MDIREDEEGVVCAKSGVHSEPRPNFKYRKYKWRHLIQMFSIMTHVNHFI